MPELTEAGIDILDSSAQRVGSVTIRLLPGVDQQSKPPALVAERNAGLSSAPEVELVEGTEYLFEFDLPEASQNVTTDHTEMFFPDAVGGMRGRLRTGLYTGTVHVILSVGNSVVGSFSFEVRSRKLDYASQYSWMLRDLADSFSEILMQQFAPAERRFRVDDGANAATLYERFAFLQQLITGSRFQAAIGQVLTNPHRIWILEEERRPPGLSIRASSGLSRQLSAPGPKVAWSGRQGHLPAAIVTQRAEETTDTLENRFVKFALVQWQAAVNELRQVLLGKAHGATRIRASRETGSVLDYLDELLNADLFRQIGDLDYLPGASQVLHRREGYREILQAYVQFEAAAQLAWQGGEDVYGAGQRDVAALYEYWVYLQLAQIISGLCAQALDLRTLFEVSRDGVSVGLKRGRGRLLTGALERFGRRINVEFWYNRTFRSVGPGAPSWTRPMRPDCSLCIRPEHAADEVWVHFDAKYRIETVQEAFGATGTLDDESPATVIAADARRDDLLKMHAYRDAIRRSAGAYVVYPGQANESHLLYHEILPGLGAFALRPSESGDAWGASSIARFIGRVVDHVALQTTQHERSRYWSSAIFRDVHYPVVAPMAPFLTKPPADTLVLLGYVRSSAQWDWIHSTKLYNLRADDRSGRVGVGSRELASEIVVLYGPARVMAEVWLVDGNPEVMTGEQLVLSGYPDPGGRAYFCLPIKHLPEEQSLCIGYEAAAELWARNAPAGMPAGAPIAVTWLDVAGVQSCGT